MSKKKHRDKRKENEGPYNINPQILDLLKGSNIDMSKVSTLMAAMNQDGFDINSISSMMQNNNFNGYSNGNNNNGLDINKINSMLNNMDNYSVDNFTNDKNNNNFMDENIEMLLSIKSVVNPKKAKFLDKVIEMYRDGKIVY